MTNFEADMSRSRNGMYYTEYVFCIYCGLHVIMQQFRFDLRVIRLNACPPLVCLFGSGMQCVAMHPLCLQFTYVRALHCTADSVK